MTKPVILFPSGDPKIKPEQEDFERVKAEYGALPPYASEKEQAHRYRLAQAAKMIRLFGQGATEDPTPFTTGKKERGA